MQHSLSSSFHFSYFVCTLHLPFSPNFLFSNFPLLNPHSLFHLLSALLFLPVVFFHSLSFLLLFLLLFLSIFPLLLFPFYFSLLLSFPPFPTLLALFILSLHIAFFHSLSFFLFDLNSTLILFIFTSTAYHYFCTRI